MNLPLQLSRSKGLSMVSFNGLCSSSAPTCEKKYGYIAWQCQTALHGENVPVCNSYVSSVLLEKERYGSEMFENVP